MPMFAKMKPAPRMALQHFQAGVHMLWGKEDGMPKGIMPAVSKSWDDAIKKGYFIQ